MRLKICFILFTAVFFSACSFKQEPNQWQYKSANSFKSYTGNFLKGDYLSAKGDIQAAKEYAKQGADLNRLARIYLGVCALNIAVGENDKCSEYDQMKELVNSSGLDAYYHMLQNSIKEKQIRHLPEKYRSFALLSFNKKYIEAFEAVKSMDNVTSKFIASALIKNELNKEQIEYLIQRASFYGYKKLIIFWLEQLKNKESNIYQKEKIIKKIKILKS